jgi:hypothetical protein
MIMGDGGLVAVGIDLDIAGARPANHPEAILEFAVQAAGKERDRSAIGIVGGVHHELVVQRQYQAFHDVLGHRRFQIFSWR